MSYPKINGLITYAKEIDPANEIAFEAWRSLCRDTLEYRYGINAKNVFTHYSSPEEQQNIDPWLTKESEAKVRRLFAFNKGLNYLRELGKHPESLTIAKKKQREYYLSFYSKISAVAGDFIKKVLQGLADWWKNLGS